MWASKLTVFLYTPLCIFAYMHKILSKAVALLHRHQQTGLSYISDLPFLLHNAYCVFHEHHGDSLGWNLSVTVALWAVTVTAVTQSDEWLPQCIDGLEMIDSHWHKRSGHGCWHHDVARGGPTGSSETWGPLSIASHTHMHAMLQALIQELKQE